MLPQLLCLLINITSAFTSFGTTNGPRIEPGQMIPHGVEQAHPMEVPGCRDTMHCCSLKYSKDFELSNGHHGKAHTRITTRSVGVEPYLALPNSATYGCEDMSANHEGEKVQKYWLLKCHKGHRLRIYRLRSHNPTDEKTRSPIWAHCAPKHSNYHSEPLYHLVWEYKKPKP